MKEGNHSVWIALLMGFLLAGCAQRQAVRQEAVSQPPASRCQGIFVLAPAEYMRYMDEQEPVLLASEGRLEDLPVYCTREEALADLQQMMASGELIPGLWRLYRLEGTWENDVVESEPGFCRMRRPAGLAALSEQQTLMSDHRAAGPERLAALVPEAEGGRAVLLH